MRKTINKIKDMPKTRNDENFDGKKENAGNYFLYYDAYLKIPLFYHDLIAECRN